MVKTYNELNMECQGLPDVSGTYQERLTMEAAILYRVEEVYGLGIESDTTDDDDLTA